MESFPADLAIAVRKELIRRRLRPPTLIVLKRLFGAMFHASVGTDESRPIVFRIAYLNPKDPDRLPPVRRPTRHSIVRLENRLPFTPAHLRKLAPATDPRTAALTVYAGRDQQPNIWGLIDQQTHLEDFVTHEPTFGGPETPGIFQASVLAPGHIVVTWEYERLVELKAGNLAGPSIDLLADGPVQSALAPARMAFLHRVSRALLKDQVTPRPGATWRVSELWSSVLRRTLLRMQAFRHGGTLLITPDAKMKGLVMKYPLTYDRVRSAVFDCAVAREAFWESQHRMPDSGDVSAPAWARLYARRMRADYTDSELQSCVWFISLLTRVDGAVVLSPDLMVLGFGAEITVGKEPSTVHSARTASPRKNDLHRIDYHQFGTRHRSVIRYCAEVRDSVGFVVSQDGDVRAMAASGHRRSVLLWDRLRLRKELPDVLAMQRSHGIVAG